MEKLENNQGNSKKIYKEFENKTLNIYLHIERMRKYRKPKQIMEARL